MWCVDTKQQSLSPGDLTVSFNSVSEHLESWELPIFIRYPLIKTQKGPERQDLIDS